METIEAIDSDPLAMWGGQGDYCEWIDVTDKRWKAGGIDSDVVPCISMLDKLDIVYIEAISELFKPIAHKCIYFQDGNHEQHWNSHHTTNTAVRILEKMGQPDLYTQWAGMTRVRFSDGNHRIPYTVYHEHGYQAGRTPASGINSLHRLLSYIEADLYVQGHDHKRIVLPETRIRTDQDFTRLVAEKVYLARTGSFLRTYQQDTVSYAEIAGYPPTSLGPIKFHISPRFLTGGRMRLDVEAVQ